MSLFRYLTILLYSFFAWLVVYLIVYGVFCLVMWQAPQWPSDEFLQIAGLIWLFQGMKTFKDIVSGG